MPTASGSLSLQYKREARTGWLMAAPASILILLFLIVPFFMGFYFSFTNQRLISPNPTEWVGLRNFKSLLTVKTLSVEPMMDEITGEALRDEAGEIVYPQLRDFTRNPEYPELKGLRELRSWQKGDTRRYLLVSDIVFIKALRNTLIFVIVIAPVQGGLAMLLALLLNRRMKGINIFRTMYFMPVVVSMVVVALLWRFIYDGENGLLNTLLGYISFGRIQPQDWLGSTRTALPAMIAMSVWQAVGFHMIIWLAGLQSIPGSRYEAASIDGAGTLQKFRYVTWPGLRNTAVFVLLVITMQAFALFTQVDVMTRGGPLDATQSIVYQMVVRGSSKQDIAGGSAISVLFFFMVLIVSLIQRRVTQEKTS